MKGLQFSYTQWLDCVGAVRWFVNDITRRIRMWRLILSGIRYWRLPPDEGGGFRAGAGKPVPRGPVPRHHLVAAKALPPSDKTYLFPRD